jgi:hypothetical protein
MLLRVKSENDIEFMKSISEQFQSYKPENMYQQKNIYIHIKSYFEEISPYLRMTAKPEEILHYGGQRFNFEHLFFLILDTDVPTVRPAEFSSLHHNILS